MASGTLGVGKEVEVRADGHVSRGVKAVVDSLLERVDVPSVDEITVVSKSSWVTVSKDKRLSGVQGLVPHVFVVVGLVDSLEEDRDEMNWVRGWACTIVVSTRFRERNVAAVRRRVQVDTVPAAREEDLSTNTIGAVVARQTVGLSSSRTIVVEACETDSVGLEVASEVALEWVTRDHAEASWEGHERVVVGTGALEVVDSCATKRSTSVTSLRHSLNTAVGKLEVELGSPVSGQIGSDRAGGTAGVAELVVIGVEAKAWRLLVLETARTRQSSLTITTNNSVSVSRDLTGEDERVNTLVNQTRRAGHAPEGSSWTSQSRESSNRCSEVHVDV